MRTIHKCKCAVCQAEEPHPAKARHIEINEMMCRLDERQRRWYAATEAKALKFGGITRMSEITGLTRNTIRLGIQELNSSAPAERPDGLLRAPGGGRPRIEQSQPGIGKALEKILESEAAGDPEGRSRWVRASLDELKRQLSALGYRVGRTTISRMLKDKGYSLRVNAKMKAEASHPRRDEQFRYIEKQKQAFTS